MGFFNTRMKFLIDRVPSLAGFGVLTENNPYAETFQTSPHMSNSDSRNSSYAFESLGSLPVKFRLKLGNQKSFVQ
jgi:hypothetical protein